MLHYKIKQHIRIHKISNNFALLLALTIIPFISFSNTIDSLKAVINNDNDNIDRITHLHILASEFSNTNLDSAIYYNKKSLDLALKINYQKGVATRYFNLGVNYSDKNDFSNAIEYFLSALDISKKSGDDRITANCYDNIGIIYSIQEQYDQAIKNNLKALEIREKIKDKSGISMSYSNLGVIEFYSGNYKKAIDYYKKSIEIDLELKDNVGLSYSYNNMAAIYQEQKLYDKAIVFFFKAQEINESLGNIYDISTGLLNISTVYYQMVLAANNNETKRQYFLNKSLENALKAYSLIKQTSSLKLKNNIAEMLMKIYEELNDYKSALKYSKVYFSTNDSLYDKEKMELTAILQTKYETHEKELEIEKYQKEEELQKKQLAIAELRYQKNLIIRHIVIGLLVLVIIIVIIVFRNLKKNKQKSKKLSQLVDEISTQKESISEVVRKFRDTIENLEDVYFKTDRNFFYQEVSPSILKALEINNYDKIIGKHITEYWDISKENIAKLTRIMIGEKSIKNYSFVYITAKKEKKFAEINARSVYHKKRFIGIEGIIRDITDKRLAEEKINILNTQNEILLDTIPAYIYLKDTKLKYIKANNAFLDDISKTEEQILGKSDTELFNNDLSKKYESLDQEILNTKKKIFNFEEYQEDRKRWISTTKVPYININGRIEGIVGIVRDVTREKNQQIQIEEQRNTLAIVNKQIDDSINYTSRMQQNILSDINILKDNLGDSFIYFAPKDKVSGDFYWWTKINNKTIITIADCTGHGVPGAFVSTIGISFLREIIKRNYITSPDEVLNTMRDMVIDLFNQNQETLSVKDGMDMALICIDHDTNTMYYSGANSPLYIVTPRTLASLKNLTGLIDNCTNMLYELRPDKMPIAIYEKMDKFIVQKIQLEKDDQIYMFSDGFIDQFGGENGKKFKNKQFKNLLLQNSNKPMNEQKIIISNTFNKWKGSLEQVDDVTVLGIKI